MARKKSAESKWLDGYMKAYEDLVVAIPQTVTASADDDNMMTGLVIFRGDYNALVVGIRRLTNEGVPQVIWSSGGDIVTMFTNLEKAIQSGNWKLDKREQARMKNGEGDRKIS